MRLLLVEDSERLRHALAPLLAGAGYALDQAADGAEALAYLERYDYAVVVLDLMLPKVDGLEVLRTMRARGNPARVLVLSARDQVQDRVAALDRGAYDYHRETAGVLAIHLDRPGGALEGEHLRQRHRAAVVARQRRCSKRRGIVAQVLGAAHQQRYAAVAVEQAAGRHAFDPRAQLVLDRRHRQALQGPALALLWGQPATRRRPEAVRTRSRSRTAYPGPAGCRRTRRWH